MGGREREKSGDALGERLFQRKKEYKSSVNMEQQEYRVKSQLRDDEQLTPRDILLSRKASDSALN